MRIEDDSNILKKLGQMVSFDKIWQDKKAPKLFYKYPSIDDEKVVEHSQALDCIGIQNSRYIMIESNMKNLRNHYNRLKGGLFVAESKNFKSLKQWKGKLDIRYCHEREVQRKKRLFLRFKCCFLQKLRQLQVQGESQ